MTRTFPTLALLGTIALGSLAWQQQGHADDVSTATAASATASADTDLAIAVDLDIEPGPYADAVRELLATAPGDARAAAAEHFRALGPDAFAALFEALAPTVAQYRAAKSFGIGNTHEPLEPLVRLLDTVAAQRDAYAAGLYWYTDLDQAKQQAQATGKPILSLRMLGNLDDEYSCANSRFFRTVLYADTALGETLRSNFVLHWHSVRPVPVITIDMGDGRVLRRTITGNSCHLVLDSEGRPVDVIPGLYGPRTFEEQVTRAGNIALFLDYEHAEARDEMLAMLHEGSLHRLDRLWTEMTPSRVVAPHTYWLEEDEPLRVAVDLEAHLGTIDLPDGTTTLTTFADGMPTEAIVSFPTAEEAEMVTIAKGAMETTLVNAMMLNTRLAAIDSPENASAEVWNAVATFYAEGATLDDASQLLMREKTITAEQAMAMAFSKSRVEDPLLAMVMNFQNAIALDTARNEHLLHRQIHQWFIDGEAPLDPDALTSRVYAELFLTPDEDPWLGLVPPDTYSALDAGGLDNCAAP